jgi:phosphoenolpyruvate carboxykinase (ATP)
VEQRRAAGPSDDEIRGQLAGAGIAGVGQLHRNLAPTELVARSLARHESIMAANGAIVVATGPRTGRSPDDRFIIEMPGVRDSVDWGPVNLPFSADKFAHLLERASAFFGLHESFVFDGFAGADPRYRLPIRVLTTTPWHALFAQTLFLRPSEAELRGPFESGITVIDCGALGALPETEGTRSNAFIGIDLERRLILILGTMYAGEIKKSVFTVLNYLLPLRNVVPMHCAANAGRDGDVALFFGLSGTGKTALSADPHRRLIGDDEHGWSDDGVFNFEGGCYAKVIRLSATAEPKITRAITFGSILENVVVDPASRAVDFDEDAITENTRATYPLDHIRGYVHSGIGNHPRAVFFLTSDAYGVLPPIARLTPEMASYHFLSGFTSKLAGTEQGVDRPQPTFSACFGAPFMPRPAELYATMLAERLERHGTACWLVNTGWSGGPYGVGRRMEIGVTRHLLAAAMGGELDGVEFAAHPVFKVLVPRHCPGVPDTVLSPRDTWPLATAYDEQARQLAQRFADNFRRYEKTVPAEVAAASPVVTC